MYIVLMLSQYTSVARRKGVCSLANSCHQQHLQQHSTLPRRWNEKQLYVPWLTKRWDYHRGTWHSPMWTCMYQYNRPNLRQILNKVCHQVILRARSHSQSQV
jgi:hypothetical protein